MGLRWVAFGRLLADENEVDQTFGTVQCTLLDRRSSVPVRGAFVAELPQGVYDLVISARGYLSLFVRGIGVLGGYHQTLVRGLVPGEGRAPEGEPSTAIARYVHDRVGRTVSDVAIHVNGGQRAAATRRARIAAVHTYYMASCPGRTT